MYRNKTRARGHVQKLKAVSQLDPFGFLDQGSTSKFILRTRNTSAPKSHSEIILLRLKSKTGSSSTDGKS